MIKKFNFPCPVKIKNHSNVDGHRPVELPFISNDDGEFWGDVSERLSELSISIREDDDWGREEILSYLVYKEDSSTTLWIIVYDVNNDTKTLWVVINDSEKDHKIFTEFCDSLKIVD